MPRLLTRISAAGTCSVSCLTPAAVPKSAATSSTSAPRISIRIVSAAAETRFSVRPLITIRAPSRARVLAIANPMPAVEPDTTASLPLKPRSIFVSPWSWSTRGCCRSCSFDFGDLFCGQFQVARAHYAFSLFSVTRADNRTGDCRIAQYPGDCDFARPAAVASTYFAQPFHKFEIFRKLGILEFGIAAAKIIGGQRSSAFACHCAGQQARRHRRVTDDADAMLQAMRKDILFDLPAN